MQNLYSPQSILKATFHPAFLPQSPQNQTYPEYIPTITKQAIHRQSFYIHNIILHIPSSTKKSAKNSAFIVFYCENTNL